MQPELQHSSRESTLLVPPSLLRAGQPGGPSSLQRCPRRRSSGPPGPGRQLSRPVQPRLQQPLTLRRGAPAGLGWWRVLQPRQCGLREESRRDWRSEEAGAMQRSRQAASQPLQVCQQQLQTCRQHRGRRLSSSSRVAAELLLPLAGRGVAASARPQGLQQQKLGGRRRLLLSPASAHELSHPNSACPAPLARVHRWRMASAAHLAGATRCGHAGSSA